MINRGDIKLAIDMVVNAQDDELFGGEAEYVINTLEGCGNTIAAQAAVIEKLLTFVKYVAEQTPEKPDYWSSCGQCSSNSDEAEDILAIPTDSTQILAEVRRAERERCANVCSRNLIDQITYAEHAAIKKCAAAIRAME